MVELRTQELQLLSALQTIGGNATVDQIIEKSGLQDSTVMRIGLTLQEKNLISIRAKVQNVVKLTAEGELYAKNGLPERRLIREAATLGGSADLKLAAEQAGIEAQFIQIALGWAIRKKWALYTSSDNTLRVAENFVHQAFVPDGSDENLLAVLAEKGLVSLEELKDKELKDAAEQLKKRKVLTIEVKTSRTFQITPIGKTAVAEAKSAPQEITQLTPELIITGKWHTSKLQKYNIEAAVAKTWPGKKHPYLQFLDEVRAKLVQLGFQEMTGTAVETGFFNFDALFVPQDHPARRKVTFTTPKTPPMAT